MCPHAQGLMLVARVFTAVADIYAATIQGPGAEHKQKQRWIAALMDYGLCAIRDEDLLKGMLTLSPSSSSVEALASTG